jgi:hypothetical protein
MTSILGCGQIYLANSGHVMRNEAQKDIKRLFSDANEK